MQAKVAEIASVTAQKDKVQKMYDELKDKQAKIKKQGEIEVQEMALKQRDKDAEIEVLKEMIKGIKVQVKCNFSYAPNIFIAKDTDIQRLMIKIKRLEKTNEIRDQVLTHQQQQIQHQP